jgi:membrane-bound ClpP family serine protease
VAGVSGFALLWIAVKGIAQGGHTWAPLMLIAVAVSLWAVLLVRRTASPSGRLVAAGLYAFGSVGFGAVTGSPGAVAVGIAATGGLATVFPVLLRATDRLLDRPPQVGMESFEGRTATVVAWDPHTNRGTVRLEGSLWNATATVPVRPGDDVLVLGHERMELQVVPTPVIPR